MKLSFKKIFAVNNAIKCLFILFLFGIVYLLFSKNHVLEGWTDCMKIPNKSKTECKKYPDCRWFTITRRDRRGRIIETEQDCMDKNQGKK
jgi:hypothetical protein